MARLAAKKRSKGKSPPINAKRELPHVELIDGKQAQNEISAVNEELAAIFQQISLPADEHLFVANYPYGSLAVREGSFAPPCTEDPRCPGCQRLDHWVALQWSPHASLPLQLLLSGRAEAYLDAQHGTIPLRLLRAGELFGAFELSDALAGLPPGTSPWNVSSGARSVIIQANLADKRVRAALAEEVGDEFRPTPRAQEGLPWELEFVRAVALRSKWCSRILFVPPTSVFASRDDCGRLGCYVRDTSWRQSRFVRLHLVDDTVELEDEKQLVPYLTARHLRLIASGDAPAFRIIRSDEPAEMQAGPFSEVRTILKPVFSRLRMDQIPIILEPAHLTAAGESGYYSLVRPTILGPRFPIRTRNTLDDIWPAVKAICEQGESSRLDLKNTTAHTPWETSKAPNRKKRREGLGLVEYLRRDLGLPQQPDEVADAEDAKSIMRTLPLRNSRGTRSFFTACIRVVRL